MKHIRRAASYSVLVVLLDALCANRASQQDAVLAVTFGMAAGLMLAFVIGYVLMFFEESAARRAREVSP